jgi:hypothetical protein
MSGMLMSASSVIRVEIGDNYKKASLPFAVTPTPQLHAGAHTVDTPTAAPPMMVRRGSLPPAPKPAVMQSSTDLQLIWGTVKPVAPGVQANGNFSVSVEATLSGARDELQGRPFKFAVDHGRVVQTDVSTDVHGKARTTVVCNRKKPSVIKCTYNEATISVKVEFVTIGAGNVSKMAQLQPPINSMLPCWHLAL